jgi:hypothetical protein
MRESTCQPKRAVDWAPAKFAARTPIGGSEPDRYERAVGIERNLPYWVHRPFACPELTRLRMQA